MMNKRDFLISGVGAVGLASATATAAARPSPRSFPALSAGYSADRFEAFVGEVFQTDASALTLRRVERLASGGAAEQFTLHFTASAEAATAIGLQTLQHAGSAQALALHLEPGDGGTVQANFSLLG